MILGVLGRRALVRQDGGVTSATDAEVVEICRDLIRIDTFNHGAHGPGARASWDFGARVLDRSLDEA